MKKRILTITLIGIFLIGLSSCGATKSTSKGGGGGHCPAYGN